MGPTTGRRTLLLAALMGFLAVGLGAFGAHGLETRLEGDPEMAKKMEWWGTGAHYHLVHAAVLAGLGLSGRRGGAAALCFALGILLFSGSLYAMTLGAPTKLGMVTPLGGLALMVGWALLARVALRGAGAPSEDQ